jgi:hypothetical protein
MKRRTKNTKQLAIQQTLHNALLLDGPLHQSLYEYEMEENLAAWAEEMKKNGDEFVFIVTENTGDVAMVLITKEDELFINESARDFLKKEWHENYEGNLLKLLPYMAKELNLGYFSVNGVKFI